MKTINAYQSSDGQLFTDERRCRKHQDDIIGAEIDGLLKVFNLDITRMQQYKSVLHVMSNRAELLKTLREIVGHLEHDTEDDES